MPSDAPPTTSPAPTTAATPAGAPDHPLRAGVIGLGWAGQQHLDAYAAAGVPVVALAGQEPEQLERLADDNAVDTRLERWQDLLEVEGLDVVSVAVPTSLHAPIAVAALQRGLHVLSEKPVARDGDEAQTMVDAARSAHRVLDVAFNHRRRSGVQAVRELVASGELGTPYHASTFWLRRAGIPTLGSWFTSRELAGGGPLVDIGVHALDWALFALGEPRVVSVSAASHAALGPQGRGGSTGSRKTSVGGPSAFEVEDLATALLRLEGGATLVLDTSWAAYRDPVDVLGMTVLGTDGGAELVVPGGGPTETETVRVFSGEGDGTGDGGPGAGDRVLTTGVGGGHRAVVADFLDAVRGGPEQWARHDGSLALARARVIDACYRSAREGREVAL